MNVKGPAITANLAAMEARRPRRAAERQLSRPLAIQCGKINVTHAIKAERDTIEFWAQSICDKFNVERVTVTVRKANKRFEPVPAPGARNRDHKRWTIRRLGVTAYDVKDHATRERVFHAARRSAEGTD